MTTETEVFALTSVRYRFVDCALNRHGICNIINVEKDESCSCVCHGDPDFVAFCGHCGEQVDWWKNEKGSRLVVNAGTHDWHWLTCKHWKVLLKVEKREDLPGLRERLNQR